MADESKSHPSEPGAMSDALIAGLIGTASEISQGLLEVAQAQKDLVKAAALTRIQRWALGAVLALGTVGAISASVDGFIILANQHSNHQTAVQIQKATDAINDCTDPGDKTLHPPRPPGVCYARGQAQTADAIKTLVKQFGEIDGAYSVIVDQCAHAADVVSCFHIKAHETGLEK